MKNSLVRNTLILIITSLIVRVLSLANRIILTRLLGNEGISLYMISLPSIMLFISIGGFSLNIALSKIISENQVTKRYSEKSILKSSLYIGLIVALITTIILLLGIRPLITYGLKQPKAFYPILSCIVFIPLTALNNIHRGYFNGKNKINITAYANLIEQVSRIIIATIFLYIFLPYGLIISVTMAIVSMGFGELISLLYSLLRMRKYYPNDFNSIEKPTKQILKVALPTTLSRLVGNFTYFLEPIIYTLALSMIGFSSDEILFKYSAIMAYGIPLITLCSFISQSIATAIIPNISKSYAQNNYDEVNYFIKKSCLLSTIPAVLVTVLLFSFSKEYMLLIYNTEIGSNYARNLCFWFVLFYIQAPLFAIMQALGRARYLFYFSIIVSVVKIGLIFGLTFIPWISYDSLIISLLISTMISTLVIYFYLKNFFRFKFHRFDIINVIILALLTFLSLEILKAGHLNYLLSTLILTLLFFIYAKILKVTSLHDK